MKSNMTCLACVFIYVLTICVFTETVSGYCYRSSCCGEGCQCIYSSSVYDSHHTTCQCPSGVSPYNYALSPWSEWTACNVSCGGNGTQHRYRTCRGCCSNQVLQEPRDCGSDACQVNGSWTSWGGFSSCDKSCGGGWKLRFRDCTSPAPADGDLPCIGDSVEVIGCNMFHCPIDGGWSS
ncbi:thrombospondin-1-like [Saccostrea cucullata]|uniref:thrombospondin-1-like n=1 Tax=Saccostrea cuccullata TaxID=36930 RepID=UPI002ED28C7E